MTFSFPIILLFFSPKKTSLGLSQHTWLPVALCVPWHAEEEQSEMIQCMEELRIKQSEWNNIAHLQEYFEKLATVWRSWLKSCIWKKEAPFVISFPCVKGQDCDWLFFLPDFFFFFKVCQAISWVGLCRAHKCRWTILATVLLEPPFSCLSSLIELLQILFSKNYIAEAEEENRK